MEVVVTVVVLVMVVSGMVRPSVELRSSHPLHDLVDKVNENGGPYIGLVMAYPTEEIVLVESGCFISDPFIPWLDLAGRRFNIGRIKNVDVIYVMTGEKTVNAGITVQILVTTFDVLGIVHYGIAGSTDDSLSIGDVSVPTYVALTGSWNWREFMSETGQLPELKFGAFNVPSKGDNLLAKVEFTPVELYSNSRPMEETFWFPIEPKWLKMAYQLKDLDLLQCVNDTYCLPEPPQVVYGLSGATADVYLDNSAYATFLFETFNISTVDEESAAIVMTALSNGVRCIVFRGISDTAGRGDKVLSASLTSFAAANALHVAIKFIGLLSNGKQQTDR